MTSTTNCYNWGYAQGQRAYSAWLSDYPSLARSTIFGDVEAPKSAGWFSQADGANGVIGGVAWYDLNQQVIRGFLDGVNASASAPAGIYASTANWSNITNNMSLPTNAVVWVAAWGPNTDTSCLPTWNPPTIGGNAAAIWQYHGSNTLDLDAAMSLPA